MAPNERKWIIPAFWDKAYLAELEKEGLSPHVYEAYGSLSSSLMGTNNTRASLPEAGVKEISDFVNKVHSLGIKFSYSLDSMTIDNQEYNNKGRREIFKFLDWLKEIKTDSVIVANPFLARLIKEHYSSIEIKVSPSAGVDSVQKAGDWQELKVAGIKLPLVANRNFLLLRSLANCIKADLEITVNQLCLYQCSFERYHAATACIDSQTAKKWGKTPAGLFDWCHLNCNLIRWSNPAELIKSPIVRPEDVAFYQRCGIKYFNLAGRSPKMRNKIIPALKSYDSGKWPGNLLDIVAVSENPPPAELVTFYAKGDYEKFFTEPLFCVDNTKLAGFINYFVDNGHKCSYLCGTACHYCDDAAESVITLPSEERLKKFIEALNELDGASKSKEGQLFG